MLRILVTIILVPWIHGFPLQISGSIVISESSTVVPIPYNLLRSEFYARLGLDSLLIGVLDDVHLGD